MDQNLLLNSIFQNHYVLEIVYIFANYAIFAEVFPHWL